jgi:hypothetical protein
MSYSQFTTLEMIEANLGITIVDEVGIFDSIPESDYSDFLGQTLISYQLSVISYQSGFLITVHCSLKRGDRTQK